MRRPLTVSCNLSSHCQQVVVGTVCYQSTPFSAARSFLPLELSSLQRRGRKPQGSDGVLGALSSFQLPCHTLQSSTTGLSPSWHLCHRLFSLSIQTLQLTSPIPIGKEGELGFRLRQRRRGREVGGVRGGCVCVCVGGGGGGCNPVATNRCLKCEQKCNPTLSPNLTDYVGRWSQNACFAVKGSLFRKVRLQTPSTSIRHPSRFLGGRYQKAMLGVWYGCCRD